jgi:chromosome segregation ATPase
VSLHGSRATLEAERATLQAGFATLEAERGILHAERARLENELARLKTGRVRLPERIETRTQLSRGVPEVEIEVSWCRKRLGGAPSRIRTCDL